MMNFNPGDLIAVSDRYGYALVTQTLHLKSDGSRARKTTIGKLFDGDLCLAISVTGPHEDFMITDFVYIVSTKMIGWAMYVPFEVKHAFQPR
jgi:hypothetical protein